MPHPHVTSSPQPTVNPGLLESNMPPSLWRWATDSEHHELLEIAWAAALAAGTLLVAGRPDNLAVDTKTTATDVVTQMDTAAEAVIREQLLARRPDDGILGEEGGSVPGTSAVRWVVDPLDGTVNYLYRQPGWAVSIGAEVGGRAAVGVVYAPVLGEVFVGVVGMGAFLVSREGNVTRLLVDPGPPLGSALVATGFGYAASRRQGQARTLAQVLPEVRDIRRVGAAALDLCWVAAGRVDAYYERGTHPWDFTAGALIAEEAGAVVGGPPSDPDRPGTELIWAAGPELAADFYDLIVASGSFHD